MVLKDDVHLAQMEVVKQMRSELHVQIEPLREKLESTSANALIARDETRNLNERFTPVATSVSELLQNQARLFERIENLESQSSAGNMAQLQLRQSKQRCSPLPWKWVQHVVCAERLAPVDGCRCWGGNALLHRRREGWRVGLPEHNRRVRCWKLFFWRSTVLQQDR